MNRLSIIKQLTLWYSLIILVISVVLFVTFYLLTNRYLVYETDRSLTIHSSQVAYTIGTSTRDLHNQETQTILDGSQKEVPGMFVEVVDTHGVNLAMTKSEYADIARQAISSKTPSFTQTVTKDFSMRVIVYPIISNNQVVGAVIMGHQIDVYENTLQQIRTIGVLLPILIIGPSILIGYWLAKSSISPIKKLGLDINKINSENLSRHLEDTPTSEEAELLVRNFNGLLDRLNKAFNLEKQFLGEMAHEIKTPLTVIKSNAEVTLSKLRKPKEYQESLKQTLSQVDKLSENLINLMDFAWSQSPESSQNFTDVDLSQMIRDLTTSAESLADPKRIHVVSDIQENVRVSGNEDRLYQAIFNLADNAIKYSPKKANVHIMLSVEDAFALIKVQDTGQGIDKEQLKNIFNRFYRTEQTKNIAGHGLGLAISDSIIKVHGGRIEVASEKGKGSTFTVYLPLSS